MFFEFLLDPKNIKNQQLFNNLIYAILFILFFALYMMYKPFKHIKSLGQHFLKSDIVAKQIVDALSPLNMADSILEIGPGLGILTKHLISIDNKELYVSEIDNRVVQFLIKEMKIASSHIIVGDFLKIPINKYIVGNYFVIGNFPYNISSQILFKVLDNRAFIPVVVGMFQLEMAKRIAAKHGNKSYGVITVLIQAFYNVTYLFELPPEAFDPPPKVHSAVIKLQKREDPIECNEIVFKQLVKAGFNQRRKKLSNALSNFENIKEILIQLQFADKRAEQLSVDDFVLLTNTYELTK